MSAAGRTDRLVRRLARILCAVLVALAALRVATLETDVYDGYDTRVEARRLLDGTAREHRVSIRPPVLVLWGAGAEALGLGWRAPAALSLACYACTLLAVVVAVRRAGGPGWAAEAAAALLALDHLLWIDAAQGGKDAASAAACAGLLAWSGPAPRPVLRGLALGVAASLRPTNGLLALALAAGARPTRAHLGQLAVTAVVGVLTWLALGIAVHLLVQPTAAAAAGALLESIRFEAAAQGGNVAKYGGHATEVWPLVTLLRSSPALTLLAVGGALLALRRRGGAPLAWFAGPAIYGAVLVAAVHPEARYVTPLLPSVACLAAVALARAGARRGPGGRAALLAGCAAVGLAWTAPYEWARCRDPLVRASFQARVAGEAARALGPDGRLVYTTTQPFPLVPAVARAGDRFPADPFFGLRHLGPVVLEYELRRGVSMVHVQGPDGRPSPGLTDPGDLRRLVRLGRLPDGTPFRPGDVLLVGVDWVPTTWEVARRPVPPFGVHRVVRGADGRLDLALAWLRQEDGGLPRAALAAPGIVAPGAGPR